MIVNSPPPPCNTICQINRGYKDIPQVFPTPRKYRVRYIPLLAKGTVSAGRGRVYLIHTRGIPLMNPTNTLPHANTDPEYRCPNTDGHCKYRCFNTDALFPIPSLMLMLMASLNTNADAFPNSRSEYQCLCRCLP